MSVESADESADESLIPILPVINDSEVPSLSTRVSSREETTETTTEGQSSHTSCLAAIFLTVNATLGAGLLNIPHAFNDSGGIFYALIIQTIFVVLIIGSLLLLTYCSQISNASSYQEMVLAFCGVKCQQMCSIVIIVYSYGACITFLIVIGDQFDRIFLSLYGSDFSQFWYMNRSFTMAITSALSILPLSFSKKIGFLKNTSLLGFCATFYLIFLVVYQYLTIDTKNVFVKTEPKSWTEVFYITPVLCFSYQCQLSWIPTYSGMGVRMGSNRDRMKMSATVIISILICFISYTLTAIFGLMTFGSNYIENDLMSNYSANHSIVLIAILVLIAKTITVYPLLLFCGRVAVEDFFAQIYRKLNICHNRMRLELIQRISIVLIWVFSTVVIAISVPNITIAIEFLGSLATLFVFIFPGLCFLISIQIKDKNLYLLKDKIYIFIASFYITSGVFIFGLSLTQTIQKNLFK